MQTMELKLESPPHIRLRDSAATMMCDVIIAMIPLYAMAFFYYGTRAIALGLISAAVCLVADNICKLIAGKKPSLRECSALVTGLMIPLLLSAAVDIKIVILADLFAILVAKHPFGGVGQNIFNPAAAGIAFVTISYAEQIFKYPIPMDNRLGLIIDSTVTLVQSPSAALNMGGVPVIDSMDMIFGNFSGPMGATNILVLIACLIFLIMRKTIRWHMPAIYLGVSALISMVFIRANMSVMQSLTYELSSGVLLFVAVFMITDPVTSPSRDIGRMLYAGIAAVLTMLFRNIGAFEQTAVFVIIIMNSITAVFDIVGEKIYAKIRREKLESKSAKKAV